MNNISTFNNPAFGSVRAVSVNDEPYFVGKDVAEILGYSNPRKAMEMSLFEVKESTINNPDGSVRVTRTTKVTGKGQTYFVKKFLS